MANLNTFWSVSSVTALLISDQKGFFFEDYKYVETSFKKCYFICVLLLSLLPGFFCLRQMQVHLVTVEVRVVGRADALIEAEGSVLEDLRAVRHDRQTMKRRLTIEKNDVAVNLKHTNDCKLKISFESNRFFN